MSSTVDYFKALVPIANPSGKEALIRAAIQTQLLQLDLPAGEVDDHGNLWVTVPGAPDKAPLLLCAHMDSVPPCEGIECTEDVIEGRTVIRSAGKTILGADDKSGIAVILAILARLQQQATSTHHPLEILFSTQEEVGLLGAKGFDRSIIQSQMGFVLDGEGHVGDVFYAGPTHKSLQFDFKGVRSHAGIAPEAGVNAINMAAHLCASLPCGRLSPDTTLNIGVIEGGDAFNIVAPSAVLKGEARSHDDSALECLLQQVSEVCEEIQTEFPRGQVSFTPVHKYNGFVVPDESPVIQKAKDAALAVGLAPKLLRMNIGSDAHMLNHYGIPSVVLGMGFHFSHSLGEYIDVAELEQVTEWVWQILQ